MREHKSKLVNGEYVVETDYYTDWNEFWDFYITSVRNDLGDNKFRVTPDSKKSKFLQRIDGDFKIKILNPLIRKEGLIPSSVILRYDPNKTTFYSTYDTSKKKYVVGYPAFTKYMCYWQPAMEAAFRHEMGHILRGDCILGLPFGRVSNANKCMDIRINAQLDRLAMEQVYKCLYFQDKTEPLLVPEQQFPKCGLPYNEETPFDIPTWDVISYYMKNAAANQPKPPIDPDDDENKPPQKDKFDVGDYVVINSGVSEYNDRPGKIVGKEGDNFIVEEISQEEFNEIMGFIEDTNNPPTMLSANIILGEFRDDELLPLQQGDETGDKDQDGDDDDSGGGGEEEQEQETEDEGGEGDGEDEGVESENDTEDSIDKKGKILDELKNGGIDGNPTDQEIEDDDEVKGGDDEENQEGEDKEGEDEEDESGDGEDKEGDDKEGDDKEGDDKDGKDKDGKDKDGKDGKSEREKILDEKIKEQKLKNDIQKSLNNFNNIKDKHGEFLTSSEKDNIQNTIEELEKLI